MPNVMVALPNIGGALCSMPQFGSRPLLDCHVVTLPIGECKTWKMQSEFCAWQNSVTELKIYI